jgi:hypothetical protein
VVGLTKSAYKFGNGVYFLHRCGSSPDPAPTRYIVLFLDVATDRSFATHFGSKIAGMMGLRRIELMSHDNGKDDVFQSLDASAGLYHEAQADGVPYDEESDSFSSDSTASSRN